MASIGLKVNGKIFAMMVRGHFVAKLPGAESMNSSRLASGNPSIPAAMVDP